MFRTLALAAVVITASCASVPSHDSLAGLALRLETDQSICSGTPVGPALILSAAHCFEGATTLKVNGREAAIKAVVDKGPDRVVVVVAGVGFTRWATIVGPPKQGDRVRWWGNPHGTENVFRVGYVSHVADGYVLVDATICRGDSGAALFSDEGEVVGVVSAMTDANGCTFMVGR